MGHNYAAKLASNSSSSPANDTLMSKEAAAPAFIAQISDNLSQLISPIRRIFTFTSGEPLGLNVLKKVYRGALHRGSSEALSSISTVAAATSHSDPIPRSSSWLSDFDFLKSLTPSRKFNNLVIDTLEGQIITLTIVTAFILCFLIREWVVQQQPVLNGGPNVENARLLAQGVGNQHQQDNAEPRPQAPQGENGMALDEDRQAQRPRARNVARARPRSPRNPRRISDEVENLPIGAAAEASEAEELDLENTESLSKEGQQNDPIDNRSSQSSSGVPQRPAMPDRDTLARAAEIRRTIEEQSRVSGDQNLPNVFNELWARASNQPSEVLRIIEADGRGEELAWIVTAMRKVEDAGPPAIATQEPVHSSHDSSPSTSEDGSESSRNNASGALEDDEGFVILNNSSLSPSQEAETESSSKMKGAIDPWEEAAMQGREETSILGPPAMSSDADTPNDTMAIDDPDLSTSANSYSESTKVRRNSPARETEGDVRADHPHSITVDGRDGVPDSSHTNPFHPDYVGELPESSSHPDTNMSPDIDPNVAETEQSRISRTDLGNSPSPGDTIQENSEQPPDIPAQPQSIVEAIAYWLWGGLALPPDQVEDPAGDDEHVVNEIADEAPFVPVAHGQPQMPAPNEDNVPGQDPEVVAAALQAGIDPNENEAVDDIEDLEGMMELVGMQGPLAGLIQNGMFCACLVSMTIVFAIWIPYMSGKLFLVLLTHPVSLLIKLPLRWASLTADVMIDFFTFGAGCAFYWTDSFLSMICIPLRWVVPVLGVLSRKNTPAETAKRYAEGALDRLGDSFIAAGAKLAEYDLPEFSIVAHESLKTIETRLGIVLLAIWNFAIDSFQATRQSSGFPEAVRLVGLSLAHHAKVLIGFAVGQSLSMWSSFPSLLQISPLRINLSTQQRIEPLDYELANWHTKDRALAIFFGYLFFAVLGIIYLNLRAMTRGINKAGRVDGGLADILYQAGGVMKVILIIGIEMIVFPLYCGLLLDVALLPLFDNVTLVSRIDFTLTSPNTSIFIHWFVGTCYMFHFALFVSMCRGIMRKGVLCELLPMSHQENLLTLLTDFIRDPDDPTFHPVRDVLERSVSTQLWKISFSALVYGGLVIVCLGGVVWGMAYSIEGLFPIHWSSNEPVLEFPVDLLFYNFLMPLAVKFFKPSKGLNRIYDWWFRKCARALRLTNFLFNEKKKDEEGRHVRRTWAHFFKREQGDPSNPVIGEDQLRLADDRNSPVYFLRDGIYVRAPASDQVRIPKGAHTFLEVDENNNRLDDRPDSHEGPHGLKNDMFTVVYIPPLFRLRISVFIFLIWLFAAATGICITIVPLIYGRFIFGLLTPNHLRMNDIYAFSLGMYILGGTLWCALNRHRILKYIRRSITPHHTTITSFLHNTLSLSVRLLGLTYTYAAFAILIPALFSLLMEFYLIIPVHTYFSTSFTSLNNIHSERHIIHLIQDWTLGVLYLKMAARFILWNSPSRPSSAMRGIVRNGWLNPDVRLATRGFIFPACLVMLSALVAPLALGWLANATFLHAYSTNNEIFKACVYRYSYPGVLALACAAGFAFLLGKAFSGWRRRVRDDVYLIGERLHNFGEGRKRDGKGKGKRAVVGRA